MRLVVVLLAVSVRLAAAGPAGPDPDDKARADQLFQEGRDHLSKGDRVGACKLFDESFAKDPRAVGTMLNLGLCREEGGAVASAVRFYAEARDRARDQNL
jgi:Tfp pilus assembly protein PilF